MKELYTIGYSNFSIDDFILTLKNHNIDALADVRSQPYSRFKPEYNKENLKRVLNDNDIRYVFLGDQCGARSEDENCYIGERADYNLIKNTVLFQKGLERIKKGLEKYSIVLLCAEKDPITCHRNILVCRNLKMDKLSINHIITKNEIEPNEESEKRLLKLFNLDQNDLFSDKDSLLNEAYDRQGKMIAYTRFIEGAFSA